MIIDRTRTEAEQLAKKTKGVGICLYEIPIEDWVDDYGKEGRTLYKHLRNSQYGYVRDPLVSLTKMMDFDHV